METEMNLETTQIAAGIPRPKISDSTQHWSTVTPLIPEACVAIIVDLQQVNLGRQELLPSYTTFPRGNFALKRLFQQAVSTPRVRLRIVWDDGRLYTGKERLRK